MPNYSDNLTNKKNISPRFAFGLLAFLGFLTLLLGVFKISQGIRGPFNELRITNYELRNSNLNNQEILKTKDTDQDGLSDYDELYFYNTSPYLKDSDSDGYDDKTEISSGNDPNCPKGKNCREERIPEDYTNINTNINLPPVENQLFEELEPQEENTNTDINLPSEMTEELQNLTPDQIRELLLSSGKISQEQLDQIDDQTLLEVFKEVLKGE